MSCDCICNSFSRGWDSFTHNVSKANEKTSNLCQRIGLPRDTVQKALISFVASFAIGLLAAAILAGTFNPIGALIAGTVALTASMLHAVAVSTLRNTFHPKSDMAWYAHTALQITVLIGTALLVSTFMPYRVDLLAILFFAGMSTIMSLALNRGLNRQSMNNSAIYLM